MRRTEHNFVHKSNTAIRNLRFSWRYKNTFSSYVTPCSLMEVYRYFERTHCLYRHSSTLTMDKVRLSQKSMNFYIVWSHSPEDSILQIKLEFYHLIMPSVSLLIADSFQLSGLIPGVLPTAVRKTKSCRCIFHGPPSRSVASTSFHLHILYMLARYIST
jgi:hypothetical protein